MLLDSLSLIPEPALMAAGGLIVGILVGMTGVGAGALTTPMLISGFGVAPAVAVGTDLLFAGLTKIGGAWRHHRLGHVNWPIFLTLALGSVSAALATLAVIGLVVPDKDALAGTIRGVLAVSLVISAIAVPIIPFLILRRRKETRQVRLRPISTVLMGALIGTIVTLSSVGAGAIGVAILSALYPTLQARRIVGTDIVHAVPLTLLSGMGHLSLGNIDYAVLGALLLGSVPGILIGSRLTARVPDWVLRAILSLVLALSAALVVMK